MPTVVTPMGSGTGTGIITIRMDESLARLKLFAWLSPNFPVGAFAFSHGLEWAAEAGDLPDAKALRAWLEDLLRHGAPRADAVLVGLVYRQPDQLDTTNELALALSPSTERRLETGAQGSAFLAAVAAAWPDPALARLEDTYRHREIAYPVALGAAAAAHRLPLRATLEMFVLSTVANLVSAALRLGIIGQTEGQRIIADLAPVAAAVAREAETASSDDLGTCAWRSDIAAMRHESQYSRLFRS